MHVVANCRLKKVLKVVWHLLQRQNSKIMEFKDSFREQMIALDEIGFIGNPRAKNSKKQTFITSAYFQALRNMRKEQCRSLTDEEKNKVIKEAELAYNREVRQRRKVKTFGSVASVTL